MRVLGISTVKNERDIVERFVRHNLDFLDGLLVLDNGSTDGTRDILRKLQREKLPIVIFDEPTAAYRQSEWMTRLLKNSIRFFAADRVVPLDADEFILAPSPAAFRGALATIPAGHAGELPWVTYAWSQSSADSAGYGPLRFRRACERPTWTKVVIRVDGDDADALQIDQGNHSLSGRDERPLPTAPLEGCALAHVPVRGREQLAFKVVAGWLAYVARDGTRARASDQGYHWREIFELVAAGRLTDETVDRVWFNYAQSSGVCDPIPPDGIVEDPIAIRGGEPRYCARGQGPVESLAGLIDQALRVVSASTQPPTEGSRSLPTHFELQPAPRSVTLWRRLLGRSKDVSEHGGDGGANGRFESETPRRNQSLDLAPMRYLFESLGPSSLLGLGGGSDACAAAFASWGVQTVTALDGCQPTEARPRSHEQYRVHDFAKPLDLGRRYELVLCNQVVEHLPHDRARVLLASIERHAERYMLFCAADVGQSGQAHSNCRSLADWIDELAARGWTVDAFASLAFRALSTVPWFRRNPIMLARDRADLIPSSLAVEDLLDLAARPSPWFDQDSATHEHPLRAELPSQPG